MAPLKDIRRKLLATFQIEHREHLEQIRSLLAMAAATDGHTAGSELEEAFRRAHSLKGAARAVDLQPVEGLAHRLETLFSRVRQGTLILDKEVTAVVQRSAADAGRQRRLRDRSGRQPAHTRLWTRPAVHRAVTGSGGGGRDCRGARDAGARPAVSAARYSPDHDSQFRWAASLGRAASG
jgi:chemotaxis protein histidine kinase CheA